MTKSKDELKNSSKKGKKVKEVDAVYVEKKRPKTKNTVSKEKLQTTNDDTKVGNLSKTKEQKTVTKLEKDSTFNESSRDAIESKSSEKTEIIDESGNRKAYFFPRFLAYVIDFIIVTLLTTVVLNVIPQDPNYKIYLDEYQKIQAEFVAQEITPDEYVNKSVDVIYDLDYSNVIPMIIEVVVLILYYIVFQFYNKGQTFGKRLLKIRVVSEDSSDVSMNQLILRSFIVPAIISKMLIIALVLFMGRGNYYYGSFMVQGLQIGLFIVSIFMIMYSKTGRGLHDRLAKTSVIMTD